MTGKSSKARPKGLRAKPRSAISSSRDSRSSFSDHERFLTVESDGALPAELWDRLASAGARASWEISPKKWRVYFGESSPALEAALAEFPNLKTLWEEEPRVDWAARYQESLAPFTVGSRFAVLPSKEMRNPWSGRIAIRLIPGGAFGTGEHFTTSSCLRVWEELPKRPDSVFDVGCGSGILAVASWLDGCRRVVACDNDPEACRVARETAALNGADITVVDGSAGAVEGEFECVFANILAETLIELFPSLCARVADNGYLIGSGIANGKQTDIINIAVTHSLEVLDKRSDGEWWTFAWRKKSPLRA